MIPGEILTNTALPEHIIPPALIFGRAEPMERMGTFRVYVSGLSGEAVWYKDGKETPMGKADWVKMKPEDAGMILRKTLELEFQVPGDEFFQGRDAVNDKGERWVMR